MKKILVFATLIFLLGCSAKTTPEIKSSSADGSNEIRVYGTKEAGMIPFQAHIILKGNGMEDTLVTEVYASDLNAETVKFTWTDNQNCELRFEQTDKPRVLFASFTNNGLRMVDANQLKESL